MKTKLTNAQEKVMDRWSEHPDWLIVECGYPINAIFFFADPVAKLTEKIHRWAFGGLQFRGLLRVIEKTNDRTYYDLTPAGRELLKKGKGE